MYDKKTFIFSINLQFQGTLKSVPLATWRLLKMIFDFHLSIGQKSAVFIDYQVRLLCIQNYILNPCLQWACVRDWYIMNSSVIGEFD